mgnify:CR=1 FL=1
MKKKAMMKPECKIITAAVERVFAFAATLNPPDVLLWADLERLTGFIRHRGDKWGAFARRLNRKFQQERGITLHLKAVGTGWMLCGFAEIQSHVAPKRMQKALRQTTRIVKAVNAVKDDDLDINGKVNKSRLMEKTKLAASAIRRNRKDISQIQPQPKPPLRPVPSRGN